MCFLFDMPLNTGCVITASNAKKKLFILFFYPHAQFFYLSRWLAEFFFKVVKGDTVGKNLYEKEKKMPKMHVSKHFQISLKI